MSEDEEIEAIRRKKREQLQGQLESSTPDEPIHVQGREHFQELVGSHRILLVDFHADWCGPCKMLEPTVAEIAAETDAAVAKVDVDANPALAQEYQVQGVPTLYLFADGEVAERMVGVQEKGSLVQSIQAHA